MKKSIVWATVGLLLAAGTAAAYPAAAAPSALKVSVKVSGMRSYTSSIGNGPKTLHISAIVTAKTTNGASCSGNVQLMSGGHRLSARTVTGGKATWLFTASSRNLQFSPGFNSANVTCKLGTRQGSGTGKF